MAVVLIPAAFRRFAGGVSRLEAAGDTVSDVLKALVNTHPALGRVLFTKTGEIRPALRAFVNGVDVTSRMEMRTPITPSAEMMLVPCAAGGAGVPLSPAETVIDAARQAGAQLSNDEILRYSRHLILPEVNLDGQKKLKAAKVLCIGAGGLGSPLLMYLAAAGVGTIGIVDFDIVDYTNLQRQIIHGTSDVGRTKMQSAKETIASINPNVEVIGFEEEFTSANAMRIVKDFDIVIDGTDNFPTRYLTNDVCVLLGKPNVYGSIFRFEGQATVFWADKGPCYRCLYPEPPPPGLVPSCAEGGVLGVLPGIVGCIQANEAIKLILGVGNPLIGRLMLFNALKMQFRELRLMKDPSCPICGPNATITELIDYQQFCGIRGEEAAPQAVEESEEITVVELKARMDAGEKLTVIDVREPYEYAIARIPGTTLIPLGQIAERSGELDKNTEIILHCRSGKRSADALNQLKAKGFTRLKNVVGGIMAWSEQVDPEVPRY
jgi:sulfur-carrier protein adenylyltransferase/sulfurtransferase